MRGAHALVAVIGLAMPLGCHRPRSAPSTDAAAADARGGFPAPTLFGGERGLDHVGIAVKDLRAATHTYHETLGFNRPSEGKLPNGIQNVNYYFADSTYLETMVAWDRSKADWLATFTDAHSGAFFAVLSARSRDGTAQFLSARGVEVSAPYSGTIQTAFDDAAAAEKWQTFFLPAGLLPGPSGSLYFISYAREPRVEFLQKLEDPKLRRRFFHKNTALGLRAVWFAVPDLGAAHKAYESIGLVSERTFTEAELGADGEVFGAGAGAIRLLAPRSPDGAVAAFLRERGQAGIMGVTLAAGRIETAAEVIGEGTGVRLPTYEGLLGKSLRVPPELTQGVWLEFTQQ